MGADLYQAEKTEKDDRDKEPESFRNQLHAVPEVLYWKGTIKTTVRAGSEYKTEGEHPDSVFKSKWERNWMVSGGKQDLSEDFRGTEDIGKGISDRGGFSFL